MFRILVVEDDAAAAYLLSNVMENLRHRHELCFVTDGMEALDFLHCRGAHESAPRPNLILLDMHMPRMNGLQTLTAIKNDPELCVIPVIMFSSYGSPESVRRSYAAHANCYVQKPTDLEQSVKFVQAVEAFWMDFALLPSSDEGASETLQSADSKRRAYAAGPGEGSGPTIPQGTAEARTRPMSIDDASGQKAATPASSSCCEEHNRLLNGFGVAVRELLQLHEHQFLTIVQGDTDCHRFDLLIHMANERKQLAKYAYLRHVESHGCWKTLNALNDPRT